MPFFTVIIPTYNRAALIKNAINSVLNQSYSDFELIIVDDGSTDDTKEIIASYSDERLVYLYQENAERSAARNNGIKNSSGKYICFLDSDDCYLENHLDTIYNFLNKENFPKAMVYVTSKNTYLQDYNIYETILKTIIHAQHTSIHHQILQKHKFDPKLHIAEDLDLWVRIADHFPILNIDEETVIINHHEDRTVYYLKTNSFKQGLSVFSKIYADKRWKNEISNYVKRTTISDCYFGIAKYHLYNGNIINGIINMICSIIYYSDRQAKYKINLMLKGFLNRRKLKDLLESE